MATDDAYQAYVEKRRAQIPVEIEVLPRLTEREASLLSDLLEMTASQFKAEQSLILQAAGVKIQLALTRARENPNAVTS